MKTETIKVTGTATIPLGLNAHIGTEGVPIKLNVPKDRENDRVVVMKIKSLETNMSKALANAGPIAITTSASAKLSSQGSELYKHGVALQTLVAPSNTNESVLYDDSVDIDKIEKASLGALTNAANPDMELRGSNDSKDAPVGNKSVPHVKVMRGKPYHSLAKRINLEAAQEDSTRLAIPFMESKDGGDFIWIASKLYGEHLDEFKEAANTVDFTTLGNIKFYARPANHGTFRELYSSEQGQELNAPDLAVNLSVKYELEVVSV